MITIYDIAKKAGVSPMTVSRVINKSGNVSDVTRKKVEKIIKEMNYIPNSTARSLVSKKSKVLSLLITDITNPFFTKIARGAEDKAMEMGYQFFLYNSDEKLNKETEYVKMILSAHVAGVLFAPAGDQSLNNLQTLIKYDVPFVLLDRHVEGIQSDLVHGDNFLGTKKLIKYLVERGHKRIALINGPSNVSSARERLSAYKYMLRQFNIPIYQHLIFETNYKYDTMKDHIMKLLSLPESEKPTAIFAANNFIAAKTIKALQEHDVTALKDMDIVCFDDLNPMSDIDPFLTIASQPAYEIGEIGTQLLIERIEGKAPKVFRKVTLPPKLLIKQNLILSKSLIG